MNRSNRSDNYHDQLIDYVLGNLTPDEIRLLQKQISANPELAHELAALQESITTLPYNLPPVPPSENLKSSLLEQAAATQRARKTSPPTKAKRQRQRWIPLTGVIAASLAIALGLDNLRLRQQVAEVDQLRQALQISQARVEQLENQMQDLNVVVASLQTPDAIVYPLIGIGAADGATGHLVAVAGQTGMVLVSENLPPLSEQQVYRLWAIADATASPEYCGQFRPSVSGTTQWTAPTETCSQNPDNLLITLDAPEDPIDSAGPLVMQSQT